MLRWFGRSRNSIKPCLNNNDLLSNCPDRIIGRVRFSNEAVSVGTISGIISTNVPGLIKNFEAAAPSTAPRGDGLEIESYMITISLDPFNPKASLTIS